MRELPDQDVFEPIVRGITQSGVRLANERAVLTLIAGIPGVSNADIARRSGLGPQTTARILTDLESRDLIIRGEVLRGRRGQPATPYHLNPQGGYSLGVEIGWQHVEVLLQNIAGQPIAVTRRCYDFPDPETLFSEIAADVETLLSGLTSDQRDRVAGIGVTSPGNFGPLLAHIGAPPCVIEAWSDVEVGPRLTEETGLPALWVNDGSAVAWREITAFPTPRPKGLASFFVGTFVGGGVVSDGSLLEGPYGNSADLGAIVVHDRAGKPAYLHLTASLHALVLKVIDAGHTAPVGSPRKWDWAGLAPVVAQWLDDAGHALAQAILTTTAMTEVDVVALNGDLPESILARLVESTNAHLLRFPVLLAHRPRLTTGLGGPSAAALGAAQLLLFRRHFSRAWELFDPAQDK